MKLLLDTHIFLWFIDENEKLSAKFKQAIEDTNNEIFLSTASVWECVIKYQLGKLTFSNSPEVYLPLQRKKHLIKSLVIDEDSISQLINLPSLHRDPFDRLLISQALQHDLTMVTEDKAILVYPHVRFLNINSDE